jgi:hypothetical protein
MPSDDQPTSKDPLDEEEPAPAGVASDTSHFEQSDSEEPAEYVD